MKTTKRQPPTPDNLSLIEIMEHFPTDEEARSYLESIRWPDGPACVKCGNADADRIYPIAPNPAKKVRPGLYECGECREQFTVTVGTIFEKSKVPLRKWLIAWYLLCSSKKGFSAKQLERTIKVSYRTAWFMMHRIRYALRDPSFRDKLTGTVEADETWVGGKRRGRGRGYRGNKTPVVSLVERGGRVRSQAAKKVTARTLGSALRRHVSEDAVLMTDDYGAYKKLGRGFKAHHSVNHSAGEYARGDAHTNTVEGFFSILKRGVNGIYHHMGSNYLDQYLAEFDFRYNTRKVTDGERMVAGIQKIEGKRLMLRSARSAS